MSRGKEEYHIKYKGRVISQPVFLLFLSRFMLDRSCTFYLVFILMKIVILNYTWVETSVFH